MYSTVLIVPAHLREQANASWEALGYGPDNYSVPLFSGGVLSHYGLHGWMDEAFKVAVESGRIEDQEIKNALIYSFRNDYEGHFDSIIAEKGLIIMSEGVPE